MASSSPEQYKAWTASMGVPQVPWEGGGVFMEVEHMISCQ